METEYRSRAGVGRKSKLESRNVRQQLTWKEVAYICDKRESILRQALSNTSLKLFIGLSLPYKIEVREDSLATEGENPPLGGAMSP